MKFIKRVIGTQSIFFDVELHQIFVSFEMPEGFPEETYKLTFTNSEDALTGYWVCCNTATDAMTSQQNSLLR